MSTENQNQPNGSNTAGEGNNAEPNSGQNSNTPNESKQNPEGQQKEITMTQEAFDAIVTGRLNKQKSNLEATHNAAVAELNTKIATIEAERDSFVGEIKDSVKADFDALPEEVRAIQTADINTSDGLKTIREWLPKAKDLATKIAGTADAKAEPKEKEKETPASKVPAGNGGGDPPPASQSSNTKTTEDLIKEASKKSIYRRW